MPRGGTWGYHGGWGAKKFFFPKFNQIWCVSYLDEVKGSITIRFLRERGDLRWRAIECVLVEYEIQNFIYPFIPNGISQCYKLEQSISVLRDVGWYFSFYSNFKRNFCKQTVESVIRRRILRRLIWFCTICRCPTKRTLG